MKALVVINPIAGPGRTRTIGACVDLAKSTLSAHNYDTEVLITKGPADAFNFSTDAAKRGVDLLVAWGGSRALLSLAPDTLPRLEQVRLDLPVLLFTVLVSLGTGLLFGLLPAARAARSRPSKS